MQESNESQKLIPPELQSRYSNASLLGAGAMGRVVSAFDNRLARDVAIKLLPPNSENALAVMRFQQEAKAVSKLNNPHIVQVLDFGYSQAGEPYLVMEHVRGQDLDTVVESRGSLPIPEAINIAVQLCSALEHAHNNEVVHRDLKPSNIMIDTNKSVRVLDFGLARILNMEETDWRLTRPGQPVGSILYMSPEQVRGEDADVRSDVYSLGLVILKMVNGRLPFEGEPSLDIIRSRLEAPPELPSSDDVLSAPLNKVIEKALTLEVESRFQNMAEFRVALLNIAHEAHLPVESPASSVSTRKFPDRKLVALVAILIAALTVAGYVYNARQVEQERIERIKQKHVEAKAHEPLTGDQLVSARNFLIKQKFQIVPSPGNQMGIWHADSTVTDADLAMLAGLPINSLEFEGNHTITHKGMEAISSMPIVRLALRETEIDDRSVPAFNKMPLQWLDLQECKVTDEGILQLSPSLNLNHMDLKKLDNVADKGVRYLIQTYPKMEFLSLSSTGITKDVIPEIAKLKDLEILRVAALELGDKEAACFAPLTKLQQLDISNNPITAKSLPVFEKMTKLKHLGLDFCQYLKPADVERVRKTLKNTRVTPLPGELYDKDMINNLFSDEAEAPVDSP